MVPKLLSHTSVIPAYWHAERPAEFDLDTGDGAEYGLANPLECCFAFGEKQANNQNNVKTNVLVEKSKNFPFMHLELTRSRFYNIHIMHQLDKK